MILWHTDPRRGRTVAAHCHHAADVGVRVGMPIAQAMDLAAHWHATLQEHDRRADKAALHRLAVEFQNHLCPHIGIESLAKHKWAGRHLHHPECLIGDLDGVTHLFGSEHDVLAAAAAILRRCGYVGRLVIADSVGAAWALANTAPSNRTRVSASTRSSASVGPAEPTCDFFIAPPGGTATALQHLPCQGLRLHPDVVHQLRRLGIQTIGHLMQLPRAGLATRLGREVVHQLAMALGETEESITPVRQPSELMAHLELEYPTDALDLIEDGLTRLIEEATEPLHAKQQGVLRLAITVGLCDHPPVYCQSGLFSPTLDVMHLTGLLLAALSHRSRPSKVNSLRVAITQTAPLQQSQPSMFDDDEMGGEDWTCQTETARLIDALAGRLGEAGVRGVRMTADPLPEATVHDFPLTLGARSRCASSKRTSSRRSRRSKHVGFGQVELSDNEPNDLLTKNGIGPHRDHAGRRPLALLRDPVAITAVTAPAEETAFPIAFRYRDCLHQVDSTCGPERIETQWWRGPMIRRDYFRVQFTDGSRWWVFEDLTQPKTWYLHGLFE
ncbi:MAG: DNA polymerase Y family protein [Planctomycetota bacterium]